MSRKAEILTAVCTLSCAVGIGFVMQSGEVAEMRYGSGQITAMTTTPLVGKPAVPVKVTDLSIAKADQFLDMEEITLTSAKLDLIDQVKRGLNNVVPASASPDMLDEFFEDDLGAAPRCELTARAKPAAGAMLEYALHAPCFAGERVSIAHEGMNFSEILSDAGTLDLMVPALVSDVKISASFMNGESISAFTEMPSVMLYDRVIVQWAGDAGVQIHAREFGADYGSDGHVWSGAARDFTAVVGGKGGFLTTLGNPALEVSNLAEVYTFPSMLAKTEGAIALTVETEVTDTNCGSQIQARTFQFSGGKEVSSRLMSLSVPNCSAVGNYLVLNNLLQNLTVARKQG